MRATVTVEVMYVIDVPDSLPEQVRQLARDLGETYIPVDASDREIFERIAIIRGVRGFPHDESMTPELNAQIRIDAADEEIVDYEVDNAR